MLQHANELGANAVIGARYDATESDEWGDGSVGIWTAVEVEEK